jgi:biopolymer transport protein ExbD
VSVVPGNQVPSRSAAITGINVTPLVDITLVLLIVFMVTAKLIVRRAALPLDLPKAATGGEVQEVFSVVLLAGGGTQIDGDSVASDEAVLPRARSARALDADLRAVIKADGVVPHRRVMHVLDLLRQAGVSRIGFGVEPDTTPAASANDVE